MQPNRHPVAFRGGHLDMTGGLDHAPPSRRNQRRDNPGGYNGNRNYHNGGTPNRYPKGGGGKPDLRVKRKFLLPSSLLSWVIGVNGAGIVDV